MSVRYIHIYVQSKREKEGKTKGKTFKTIQIIQIFNFDLKKISYPTRSTHLSTAIAVSVKTETYTVTGWTRNTR